MKNFKELQHPICGGPGGEMVIEKYKEMVCLLTSYEEAIYKTWSETADKKTLQGLSRPLLVRFSKKWTFQMIPIV